MRRVATLAFVIVFAALGFTAYRLLETGVEADVYRARLARLSADYGALRSQYNEVVRKTAVTELLVQGGRLSVSIRTADGRVETRLSPFDPSKAGPWMLRSASATAASPRSSAASWRRVSRSSSASAT